MIAMTFSMKTNMLAAVAVAALIAVAVAVLRADSATAERVNGGPTTAPSAEQVRAFPALGRPSGALPSAWARRFAGLDHVQKRFAPNGELARALRSPQPGGAPWFLIPGKDGVCLVTEDTGACAPTDAASAGELMIESIVPNQQSRTSPMPPPGAPIESTVYGVAPAGVDTVQATTLTGEKVKGEVANGIYTVRGTDLASVDLRSSAASGTATATAAQAPRTHTVRLLAGR